MNVAVINVSLMKLDYVGVVYLSEDLELLLQLLHVFLYVRAKDGFDSVTDLRILDAMSHAYGAKVSAAEWRLMEFVDLADVIVAVFAFDVLELALAGTGAPNCRNLAFPTRLLPLH